MAKTFEYGLTNLEFSGSEITLLPGGGWQRDKMTFNLKNVTCILQHSLDYKEVLKELCETHGSAVTATLSLVCEGDLSTEAADDLADAICELLAFATKNTVFWVTRELIAPGVGKNGFTRSLGGRARNFHSGWAIIADYVSTNSGLRAELHTFLGAVIENYTDVLRCKLRTSLLWINEAQHHHFVDLRFMSLYIGIERLRVDFLPSSKRNYIHADWQKLLNGDLAREILVAIEAKTGSLSPEQKKNLISQLRSANNPSAGLLLEELCEGLGVTGLEKDMGILRNRLAHTASYGNFEFSKVRNLEKKLSHVVDVCVLKILGYDGYYCHENTGWKNTKL